MTIVTMVPRILATVAQLSCTPLLDMGIISASALGWKGARLVQSASPRHRPTMTSASTPMAASDPLGFKLRHYPGAYLGRRTGRWARVGPSHPGGRGRRSALLAVPDAVVTSQAMV